MVEIHYGDYVETADLAGQSLAQVRARYRDELGIPEKAKVRLNDRPLKPEQEPETVLVDNDKVRFVNKSRRGLLIVGAMLLAMAITGGTFAATALTASVTATVTPESDFIAVTTGNTPSWTTFGKFVGRTGTTSEVFKLTPADGFSGDFVLILTLTNVDELSEVYQVLNMRFSAVSGSGGFTTVTSDPSEVVLSLQKPVAEIEVTGYDSGGDGSKYIDIKLNGGFYKANKGGGWTSDYEDPNIFAQVVQKGTN